MAHGPHGDTSDMPEGQGMLHSAAMAPILAEAFERGRVAAFEEGCDTSVAATAFEQGRAAGYQEVYKHAYRHYERKAKKDRGIPFIPFL